MENKSSNQVASNKTKTDGKNSHVEENTMEENVIIKDSNMLTVKYHLKNVLAEHKKPFQFEVCVVGPYATRIEWYKDGVLIQYNDRVNAVHSPPWYRLKYKSLKLSDQGIHSVVCEYRRSIVSSTALLYTITPSISVQNSLSGSLYLPPFSLRVTKHLSNLKLKVGDSIRLRAEFAIRPCDSIIYFWLKNEQPINIKYVTNDIKYSELMVLNASVKDSGVYTVVAQTTEGYVSSTSETLVMDTEIQPKIKSQVPSFIEPLEEEIEHTVAENIQMTCKISDLDHTIISWYKNEDPIMDDGDKYIFEQYDSRRIGLRIINIDEEDEGRYKVDLKNINGKIICSSSCNVKVFQKPPECLPRVKVIRHLKAVVASIGAAVTFSCSFDLGDYKYCYVVWRLGLYKIQYTTHECQVITSGNEFLLHIKVVEPDMLGNVSCHLRTVLPDHRFYELGVTRGALIYVPQMLIDREIAEAYLHPETMCAEYTSEKSTLMWSSAKGKDGVFSKDAVCEGFSTCSSREIDMSSDTGQDECSSEKNIQDLCLKSEPAQSEFVEKQNSSTLDSTTDDSSHSDIKFTSANDELLTEIIYCMIENQGTHFFTLFNIGQNRIKIIMKVTKKIIDRLPIMTIQWEQMDSLPADTWYGIDVATSGGEYMEAGVSSQPLFELKRPIPEKVMMIRIRMRCPELYAQEALIVVEPSPDKDEPLDRNFHYGTYDMYEKRYTEIKGGFIGHGGFGTVVLVRNNSDRMFAAKIVKLISKRRVTLTMREFHVMFQIDHPKIVHLYEGFFSKGTAVFVMEYLWGGHLLERIIKEKHFKENTAKYYVKQICEGLEYLHTLNIVHLDLKPENLVFVSPNSRMIKIIDYGMAHKISNFSLVGAIYGTRSYIAPEVLTHDEVSKFSDMWSLGVITYILLQGEIPFNENTSWYFRPGQNLQDEFIYDKDGWLLTSMASNFINNLLVKAPMHRMSATKALEHPWLAEKDDINAVAGSMKRWWLNQKTYLRSNKARWLRAGHAIIAANRLKKLSFPDEDGTCEFVLNQTYH